MSLASDLLPALWEIRAIPGDIGIRPHTVVLITGSWSGTHAGDGTETTVQTAITEANGQPPKVRWANNEEIAVGNLHRGTAFIGPMTPAFSGGGTALTSFGSDLTTGQTIYLKITGPHHPHGAMYRLKHVHQERATQILLEAEPVEESVA